MYNVVEGGLRAELYRLRELCAGMPTYCLCNNLAMAEEAARFLALLQGSEP